MNFAQITRSCKKIITKTIYAHLQDTPKNRKKKWAGRVKTCFMSYSNNKDADQPAHPRSLISAFVIPYLDSVMSLVSVTEISSLMLASVAEQASFSLTWSETPEDTFSHDEAQMYIIYCINLHTFKHFYMVSKKTCEQFFWSFIEPCKY